jgi:hypothetical protein
VPAINATASQAEAMPFATPAMRPNALDDITLKCCALANALLAGCWLTAIDHELPELSENSGRNRFQFFFKCLPSFCAVATGLGTAVALCVIEPMLKRQSN